jgi:hypothetical protein
VPASAPLSIAGTDEIRPTSGSSQLTATDVAME